MKTRWIVALVVVLLAIFALRSQQQSTVDPPGPVNAPAATNGLPSASPTASSTTPAPVAAVVPGTPATAPTIQPIPADGDSPPPAEMPALLIAVTPEAVREAMDNVQFALRDYRTVLGENPIGSNAEIAKALAGGNLKQVKIPVPQGSSMNAEGEMCDRWGTPYFFHQLSGKQMEIHSAGSDRKLGTNDDIVVK